MSTRRQLAASRANGQKSQGPITEAGKAQSCFKARSRFNALKHGIHAKQQIMFTGFAEDLAELAAEYHELHSPVNNEWRLRRLRCVEANSCERHYRNARKELVARAHGLRTPQIAET